MKYVIDIDGTICKEVIIPDSGGKKDYANHIPMPERIARVNALYDAGHTIKYMTAKGCVSGEHVGCPRTAGTRTGARRGLKQPGMPNALRTTAGRRGEVYGARAQQAIGDRRAK